MNKINAGAFEILVFGDGYPVSCHLIHETSIMYFNHRELANLHYVVEQAMKATRLLLPIEYKDEV